MGEFFEGLRMTRRQRYAAYVPGVGPHKSRAVQTIVHNEAVFLPIWLRYYSRFFCPQDIYVLDHESTDGSTTGEGFVRVPVEHDRIDHTWMVGVLSEHQRELLDRYDSVLTIDVDEIVAPLPSWGTLGEYIDRLDEGYVNCLGYEILHMRDREPGFRPELPILDQRGYWFANDGYDKPALATEPTPWEPGFHARSDGKMNLDPDLRMLHLHRFDYETCLARHRVRGRRAWHRDDLRAGWAKHNRLEGGRRFERWFYEDSCFEDVEIAVERIPPSWKGLI
jgi:hypothetical protein